MKKVLLFLSLLLFPLITYAESVTTFSFDDVSASPGNNVTVNLNMDNKQEFGVLTVRIRYDTSKLEYVSSEIKGLNATLRGTDKNTDKGIVALYAINLSSSKLMKDSGNILVVEFKIKDDVTEDIPLKLEIKDFGKDEKTSLKYETKDGLIKIKNNVESVTKNKSASLVDELDKAKKELNMKEDDKITWSSSDDSVANVDEDGNVTFNKNGNVTIEAKDSNGKVVYSKDYYVNDKVKKNNYLKIVIIGVITIMAIIFIILRRKKCKKEK